MSIKRILTLVLLSPFVVAWPVCIAYVFWLGFSRNEWLDDLFFHWEGISLLLVGPWIFAGAIFVTTLMEWVDMKRGHDD